MASMYYLKDRALTRRKLIKILRELEEKCANSGRPGQSGVWREVRIALQRSNVEAAVMLAWAVATQTGDGILRDLVRSVEGEQR